MAKGNFLKDLLSSFFGGNDPAAQKKRVLKNIAKSLSKSKYHFYKPNSNEVEAGLAKIFYEFYKAVSPAQVMFQSLQPNMLKRMVMEHSLTSKQKEILERLSEESINEAARKTKLKELSEKVKSDIEEFNSDFDSSKITRIDTLYTNLSIFSSFCLYDYYFMLKKFDNSLKERNFNSEPRFSAINGTYILEDLKNFIDVAWVIPFDKEWDDVFKLLRSVKGVEPVTLAIWKKIMAKVRPLRDRHIFEMLIQLISENPSYRDDFKVKELYIVDDYINEIRKTAENTLEQLKAKQTAGKVEGLLTQIFGTTEIEKLKYYNETGSAPFERKQIGSFAYAEPLAYLKHFLINYVKKDVRELSDILLVRGEWTSQSLAQPMSDAYHALMESSDKITALDNSVNETVDLGLKMKTHLPRADRDKDSRGIIESTLDFVNDEAGTLIIDSIKQLVVYDRHLKMVLEDCVKQRPELLINWKDIDHFAEEKLKDMCIEVYKKIYLLVSLLQQFPVELKND